MIYEQILALSFRKSVLRFRQSINRPRNLPEIWQGKNDDDGCVNCDDKT